MTEAVDPSEALALLREGNRRFVSGQPLERDRAAEIAATRDGQHPFAVVLGCIDSRVPPEVVFDQGIGDIFALRVAGNVVGPDQLGSLEFACRLAGARLLLVLGHTRCGAVVGALEGRELGSLTGLLGKIAPAAVVDPSESAEDAPASNLDVAAHVAEANVKLQIESVREQSPVLAAMESAGEIRIVGAMYEVESGVVRFL